MGLHTGGLAGKMDQNVKEISNIEGRKIDNSKILSVEQFDNFQKLKSKGHQYLLCILHFFWKLNLVLSPFLHNCAIPAKNQY